MGNTVFNASSGTEFSAQIDLGGSETQVTMSGNRLYGLAPNAWTIYVSSLSNILSSDNNYYFQPTVTQHVAYGPSWTRRTFAQWQAFSGQDAHSKTNWFTQPGGELSRGMILFSNADVQTFDLGYRQYLDLDQLPIFGSLTLPPYSSIILVDNGPAPFVLKTVSPILIRVNQPSGATISLGGAAFTGSSVVRWNGSSIPTTFVDSTRLTAQVPAGLLSSVGIFPVTVWDPASPETAAMLVHVVPTIYFIDLPGISR